MAKLPAIEVVAIEEHGTALETTMRYVLWAIVVLSTMKALLFIFQSLTSPLRTVPGPFLAHFGRLYYFYRVARGRWEHDDIALHRRYGPVVRVASDMYSIDTPEVVKKVYGIGSRFAKADWYDAWKHPSPDRWTLFPDRDMKRHGETRKRFQAMYSMSSLVNYEGYVDECAEIFGQRLTEFAHRKEVVDMGNWFQLYAFGRSFMLSATIMAALRYDDLRELTRSRGHRRHYIFSKIWIPGQRRRYRWPPEGFAWRAAIWNIGWDLRQMAPISF